MNQVLICILIMFSNFCFSQAALPEVKTIFSGGAPQSTQDTLIPRLIWVEGGTMKLGCTDEPSKYYDVSDEKPAHNVTISGFYIGQFEVTNAEFCRFLNANKDSLTFRFSNEYYYSNVPVRAYWHKYYNGYNFIIEDIDRAIILPKKDEPILFKPYPGFEDHPVRMVSFLAALKYTEWLSNISGKFYRLPTEAEWEYAARGGKLSKCYKDSCFTYAGSSIDYEVVDMTHYTHKVGLKQPNELGIYNMSGNVYEWVLDVYDKDYYKKLPINSSNPCREYNGPSFVDYKIRFSEKKVKKTYIPSSDDPVIQLPDAEYDQDAKELERVIKGGGFINDPISWRVSYRSSSIKADHTIGFRVVRLD